MANTIIKGDDLMLFNSDKQSIAFATNHTLSITGDAVDVSSKDHGVWKGNSVNKLSWEISSENLYTEDGYDYMFEAMISRTPITVFWGTKLETDENKSVADGDYDNWTTDGTYTGDVVITSLTANANTGENATYSVTLTGTGSIKRATA